MMSVGMGGTVGAVPQVRWVEKTLVVNMLGSTAEKSDARDLTVDIFKASAQAWWQDSVCRYQPCSWGRQQRHTDI